MRFTISLVAAVMIMAVSVSALPSSFEQDDIVRRDISVAASPLELRGNGLANGKHCSKSTECNSGNCCRGTCKVKKANGGGCYKNANCKSGYCYKKKCTSSSHPSNGHPSSGHPGGNGGVSVVTRTITSTMTQGGTTRTVTNTVTNTMSSTATTTGAGGIVITVPGGLATLTLPTALPSVVTLPGVGPVTLPALPTSIPTSGVAITIPGVLTTTLSPPAALPTLP